MITLAPPLRSMRYYSNQVSLSYYSRWALLGDGPSYYSKWALLRYYSNWAFLGLPERRHGGVIGALGIPHRLRGGLQLCRSGMIGALGLPHWHRDRLLHRGGMIGALGIPHWHRGGGLNGKLFTPA